MKGEAYPTGSGIPEEKGSSGNSRSRIGVEDILIIVCIFALWPRIFGWQAGIYVVLEYVALAVLVVIFVRRIGRIRRGK